MKTLYLERSTGSVRRGDWVADLDTTDVDRIVVGIGPGSFAGIRSALAFAQGYALAHPCAVLGVPSPCAVVAQLPLGSTAVVGDARQGKIWVALFDGLDLRREIFQVTADALATALADVTHVVTSDPERIGPQLQALLGPRYKGGVLPTEEGLRRYAEAKPETLKAEPLPIYLNPAVRSPEKP